MDYILKDDLIPIDIASRLEIKYRTAKYNFFWASNQFAENPFFHWHIDIIKSNSDNVDDLSPQLYSMVGIPDEIMVWDLLKKEILGPSSLLRCYVNAYTFGTEGFPHTDSRRQHERTVIVYLNAEWKPQWGGETVVFEGEQIEKSVLPKLGRVFVFPSNKLHTARSVTKNFRGLRTVLVYKTKPLDAPVEDVEVPELKKFLKALGIENLKHGNQTLYQHLVKTYEYLKEWGAPNHVCLAGLFHSIYGTTFYNPDIQVESSQIQELIGKKSEFLVWLFCNIDRRKIDLEFNTKTTLPLRVTSNVVDISSEQVVELSLIAKANRKAHG